MPGLFVTDPLEHLQGSLEGNWDPAKRPRGRSDDNALESAGAPVDPAAAARWSDPKLAAQRLLSPSPMPGLFVADPLEHLQGSLEGNWDPAKHSRDDSDDNVMESAGPPVDPSPGGTLERS
jgi:hypothetical protein